MSGAILRPYQIDCAARVKTEIAAGRDPLLVAPTGSGKTLIAAEVMRDAMRCGQRVLFLAHRRELIFQASQKLHAASVDHGIILAGHPMRLGEPVQVASIATLHARAIRGSAIDLPPADLIVIDEAHHCRAQTYAKLIAAYPGAALLGITATPCRGDGRGPGNAFDVLVEAPPVAELVRDGFLVPTRIYAPSRPDLKGVHVQRGDYVESELAARVDTQKLVGDIVSHWHRLAERRPTVVFACGVQHSIHIRDEFRRADVLAEHLDGTTPIEERDRILRLQKDGQVEVIVNAMVLIEGWDQPEVSCIMLARPTRSLGLYRQMVGRVLRPAPGKVDALVLDHAGAVFAHGFVEDPIIWALHEDRRAENPAQAARAKFHAPAITTCPECSAARLEGAPCPACGWRPRSKPVRVEFADGELARVDRDRRSWPQQWTSEERARFHRMLLWIARDRGYRPGWVAHKYRERFGTWPETPPWQPSAPIAPDASVRAWVRSRQIAYAKSMAKAGAA
jgi:superfamily II DNA or RNA helicase